MSKLINSTTGSPVAVGDILPDNREGEPWAVAGWENPRHAGSSGRVRVARPCGHTADDPCPWYCQGVEVREFFPHVFGLKIITD